MAFYEKQKRKQVTSGYKIKMSGLHHGLLGPSMRRPVSVKPFLSSFLFSFPEFSIEKLHTRIA
jgi:hypothetical protein